MGVAAVQFTQEHTLNTANLQLEGLIMAVAAMADVIVDKGLISRQDINAALAEAEGAIAEDDKRELSDANRAAVLFPIRVLLLAGQDAQRAKRLTFSDYAELVGRST